VTFLDEYSRYLVHWELLKSTTSGCTAPWGWFLRPQDYYRGQPSELHEARRKKLAQARHRRCEKNLGIKHTTLPLEGDPSAP
jgi:hypothetical protein